jgi:hypothetical protein
MVFQLLFALVAVAMVVVVVVVLWQLASKRRSGEQASSEHARVAEPKAPKLRMPSLGRKAPEPEPESDEPAPVRRRQLHSFAEAERSAAEADAVVLPVLEPEMEAAPEVEPVAEHVAEVEPIAEPATAVEAEPESELEAEHRTGEALDYSEAVLARLEEAFEDLQDGEITLAAYRERMQAEQAAVEARVAALQPAGDSAELDAALAARDSVLWCLDWAEEQASAEHG